VIAVLPTPSAVAHRLDGLRVLVMDDDKAGREMWGTTRIHGELLKLGIDIKEDNHI
jgi:hypothetical protein